MFQLVVEFAGLCQFFVRSTGNNAAVIMPDARKPADGRAQVAADTKFLVYHAGYVRYDLADAGVIVPTLGREDTPAFEVVHRFDRERVDFLGLPDAPTTIKSLELPDVGCFAPTVTPKQRLFTTTPPKELLMRMVLKGGTFETRADKALWAFDRTFRNDGQVYVGNFAGSVKWTSPMIYEDSITMRISRFNGAPVLDVPLAPARGGDSVHLKIANLCAENPLEWPELFLRMFNDVSDNDFKWFYRLWDHPDGDFETALRARNAQVLPVPRLVGARGGVMDCTGSRMTYDFPQVPAQRARTAKKRRK